MNMNWSESDQRSPRDFARIDQPDQIEVGDRAVGRLRVGLDAKHDVIHLQLVPRAARRQQRRRSGLRPKRGVGEGRGEKAERPAPALLDGRPPPVNRSRR